MNLLFFNFCTKLVYAGTIKDALPEEGTIYIEQAATIYWITR